MRFLPKSDTRCESALRGDIGNSDARHLAGPQRPGFIKPYVEIPLAPTVPGILSRSIGLLSLDDYFNFLIEELPSEEKALIRGQLLQPMKSLADDWTVDKLIGPARGSSAGPRRIWECMNVDETGCLNHIDRLFKLGVVFTGKSDNHVSRQCRPIECFSNSLDHPKKIVA